MSLISSLDILKKIKSVIYDLLGESAGHALYFIMLIAALLYAARSFDAGFVIFIDKALLFCLLFGILITAYGVFTHQNRAGLRLQKGFAVGTIAGALAALTGGGAYYGFDQSLCCEDELATKLFRLLEASVPMGAVFGALMGLMRPTGEPQAGQDPGGSSGDFLTFVLGFFFLLVLCLAYFVIFSNAGEWSGDRPQGLLRFWQVSILLISFIAIYVFLIVFLYGRADETGDGSLRLSKAISSTLASLLCAAALFSVPIWGLANTDFEVRTEVITCASSVNPCVDCVVGSGDEMKEFCPNDPTSLNSLNGILSRSLVLIFLVFASYLCASHPRSPVLKWFDRSVWHKLSPP